MDSSHLHSLESLAAAVIIRHGNWVQLNDPLFTLRGLGPRYAQVNSATVEDRELSYAYLDMVETSYDLITSHDFPIDLGTFDELAMSGNRDLYHAFDMAFTAGNRNKNFATKQQMALALIMARVENTSPSDELAMRRIAKWVKVYERRAWWICKNRMLAYSMNEINWKALGL